MQDKEILELQQKCEEMTVLTEEARALKDEVDVLKHNSDRVVRFSLLYFKTIIIHDRV